MTGQEQTKKVRIFSTLLLSIGVSCFIFFLFIFFSPDTNHPLSIEGIYCGLAIGALFVVIGAVGLFTVMTRQWLRISSTLLLSIGVSCIIFFLFILFSPDTNHPLAPEGIYCGLAIGTFLMAIGAAGLYTVMSLEKSLAEKTIIQDVEISLHQLTKEKGSIEVRKSQYIQEV